MFISFAPKNNQKYSGKETELFKRLYPTKNNKELAKIFGRTINAITRKGHRLDLKKLPKHQTLLCDNCGNEFYRCNSTIKHNKSKNNRKAYCSRNCYVQSSSKIVRCSGCGKDFPIAVYRYNSQKTFHCSQECKRSKPIKCDWCGDKFRRRPANRKPHNFCSKDCENKWRSEIMRGSNNINWSGGIWEGYYGLNWHKQRKKARERDNYTCQVCGITEETYGKTLDVHHIIPFIYFGLERYDEANELENLKSACNPCHNSIEPKRRKNDDN